MIDLPNCQVRRCLFDRPGEEFVEVSGGGGPDGRVLLVANGVNDGLEQAHCLFALVLPVAGEPVDRLHQERIELKQNIKLKLQTRTFFQILALISTISATYGAARIVTI